LQRTTWDTSFDHLEQRLASLQAKQESER
jgi:hypothetical protein